VSLEQLATKKFLFGLKKSQSEDWLCVVNIVDDLILNKMAIRF
jgi:hypothetical protein